MPEVTYTVRGSWPFPLDMLRFDDARAASDEDQAFIDRLSQDHATDREDFRPVNIRLVAPRKPGTDRWESFGWTVPSDLEHVFYSQLRATRREQDALFSAAMDKLTVSERAEIKRRLGRVGQ